jgi:hypothetical protein
MTIDSLLREKLDPRILELDINLACICASKGIKLAEKSGIRGKDTFLLDNRKLILDYHYLTGDYNEILKNMLKGKAILNENQLEEYQRKDFVRVYKDDADKFAFWDDYHPCCDDPEH